MSEDSCENGCVLPLYFPRRPGENPPTLHAKDCPCCSPENQIGSDISSDNRPALSHFNYRIGSYGTIREWLFHQINQTPNLKNWTHRASDDPAIALLEGASILGDILTFYQETYANEAFLRTAKWRESISDLVRLLGYRLSPAIGGNATFAFEIKKPEPVVIPKGFPLKATLKEIAQPSIFETKEEVKAYPWLNRFNLFKPLDEGDISPATTEFYITYPEQLLMPIDLKVGDRLLVGDPDISAIFGASVFSNAEIVIVDSITELHGLKTYKIKGNLKRTSNIGAFYAFRLGRTFHHFGHNGPLQIVDKSKPIKSTSKSTSETNSAPAKMESSSKVPYLNVPFTRPIKTDSGIFSNSVISPSIGDDEFPLDSEVQDIPSNAAVIIQTRIAYPGETDIAKYTDFQTLIRSIKRIDSTTMTWGGISRTVSKLKVSGPVSDSIGIGDINLINAAINTANVANTNSNNASYAAIQARDIAKNAKAAAAAAAIDATDADNEVISKKAEFATAESKAATLAVAAAVAGTALKDNTTDLRARDAVLKAQDAVNAINTAQGSTNIASLSASSSKQYWDSLTTPGAVAGQIGLSLLIPCGPFAAGFALTVAGKAKNLAIIVSQNVTTAKGKVDLAKSAADDSKRAVDAVAAAAAADVDAKARYDKAKDVADKAEIAVTTAKNDVTTSQTKADTAHAKAIQLAQDVEGAEVLAEMAEDLAEITAEIAALKEAIKVTRLYIGDALLHEVTSPLFTLKRAKKETSLISFNTLNFYGTVEEVNSLKGRRILLEKKDQAPKVLNVAEVNSLSANGTEMLSQLHEIELSESVTYSDFPNINPIVTVFGNLVEANEGKTVPEVVLGNGDATLVFQNFKLPKTPLTYHLRPDNTPTETPEAQIYVDGRMWVKVDSFFGRSAKEQIYIIREDAEGNSWVQFGDGKTGARLSYGNSNVTAIYRLGAGSFGPLKEDTKIQALAKLKNLDKIQMLDVVSGGVAPEDGENARYAAPAKVQSLGRIVSIKDFEAEAAAIPGVDRVSAAWQLVENIPAVVITVLMATGRHAEFESVRNTLITFNSLRGAGRTSIIVAEGKRMYVTASLQYMLQSGYRADLVEPEIRRALGVNFARTMGKEDQTGIFSLQQRNFGAREYASSLEGMMQNIAGVLWAESKAFTELMESDSPEEIMLPINSELKPIVPCNSKNILSLYDKHLFLTAVSA